MATGKLAKKLPKRTGKVQKQRMMEQSKKRCEERKLRNYNAQLQRQVHNNKLIFIAGIDFTTRTERRKWLENIKTTSYKF